MSPKTFFPIRMLTLRSGIAGGSMLLALLALGITKMPDSVWYPLIQFAAITIMVFLLTPSLKDMFVIFQHISKQPMYAYAFAAIIVLMINLIQSFVQKRDPFVGSGSAIGRTPLIPPLALCPPELDFDFERGIDTDTERQMPACISDANELTEQQQLDKIDIYLRDSQESIARITSYLNIAKPDERWMSKKEMDDPNNRDLTK